MTVGKGYSEDAFKGAMERLVHLGSIAFEQKLWKGENYHWKSGIGRAESNPPTPANPLADDPQKRQKSAIFDPPTPFRQPSANPHEKPQKTVRQPPSANPTPLKGGIGRAPEGGPPIHDPDELDWT